MKSIEAKCRKCKNYYLMEIEDFHEEIECECPYCEHEEHYNFFSVCECCGNETGFHLGSLTDTLIDIGSEMVEMALNPVRGIRALKTFTNWGNLGRHGECSICGIKATECPECLTINFSGKDYYELDKKFSCNGCQNRYYGT